MPPNDRPGAMRLTVESIADTVELLFGWLAGPDPIAPVPDADIHDEKTVVDAAPPAECIDTEGEELP